MTDRSPDLLRLQPLPYHLAMVEYLKTREPEVWQWASSLGEQEEHAKQVRSRLLRETYRLSPESHASAHSACRRVADRLGIDAPTTLYQANAGDMNAALCFLPGEIHVVLSGPVLDRLDDSELEALFGHELSHYLLWSRDGGDFLVADRILGHVMAHPAATQSQANAWRLYGLFTELFADRGAAIAAGSPVPAITILVKVQTGLTAVDAIAYLRQAEEIELGGAHVSEGVSHPEAFLRAQAVDKWWRDDADQDRWLERRVRGPLSMDQLDLLGQCELTELTRGFIDAFLGPAWMQTPAVTVQARAYFADWQPRSAAPDWTAWSGDRFDASVGEYFNYVMLDLALADPDLRDDAIVEAIRASRRFGGEKALLAALRKDVGMNKREVDQAAQRATKADAAAVRA